MTYGLRINSIRGLRKKNLKFLNTDKKFIHFPDTKTERPRKEKIEDDLIELFKSHTSENKIEI